MSSPNEGAQPLALESFIAVAVQLGSSLQDLRAAVTAEAKSLAIGRAVTQLTELARLAGRDLVKPEFEQRAERFLGRWNRGEVRHPEMVLAQAEEFLGELSTAARARRCVSTSSARHELYLDRTAGLRSLLDELDSLEFNVNAYQDDPGAASFYDSLLSGKIAGLRRYFETLGWTSLGDSLESLDVPGHAFEVLVRMRAFAVPEARRQLALGEVGSPQGSLDWFWELVHPRVRHLARSRYEDGYYGNAVEGTLKDLNETMKRLVKSLDGRELDGVDLMLTALSPKKPVIKLAEQDTQSGRDSQQGYMEIFAGTMRAIRNPGAHANVDHEPSKALHLLALVSLLLMTLDARLPTDEENKG